jgi:peptidoglycan hydrolase-like protein with peptidoglycan-binding domain
VLLKPSPAEWRDLRIGLAGHDVVAWQSVLRYERRPDGWQARWPITADGQFGPMTAAATKAYQARRGLSATGVVDALTRAVVDPSLFGSVAPPVDVGLPPIAFVQARDYGWAERTTIDVIVLHSAEVGEFHSSAEAVASFFKSGPPKPASAHYTVDDDSIVQSVKDAHIAFHAPGVNTRSLGIEQAGYAKQTRDEWLDPYGQRMLRLVARLVAYKAKQYDVPLVWLTPEDLVAGARGICTHVDVSKAFRKSKHYDCGPGYPKDIVLQWVHEALADALLVT